MTSIGFPEKTLVKKTKEQTDFYVRLFFMEI